MSRSLVLSVMLSAVVLAGCRSTAKPPEASTRPATIAAARPATLAVQLAEILNRRADAGAFVAARVVDPATGKELFAQDAGRPVTPASNMKLTVTSAALDFFGPDAEFATDLSVVGDDLYLVGHGDPATGDPAILSANKRPENAILDAWADELIARGITSLAGNLYYVDNAFEPRQVHPDWSPGDLVEWYAAPIGGLNYNDNCVDAVLTPAGPGEPAKVELIPMTTQSITLVNQSVTGESKDGPQDVDWTRADSSNVYTITGQVAKVTKLQSKPVTDPGAFFADALKTRLAHKGVTIAGSIMRAETLPGNFAGTRIELKPATTQFKDILWRINKNSQNLLAEGVAKKLGMAFDAAHPQQASLIRRGSWQNADRAIRAFLRGQKIDATGYQFADGSGLSRQNKVTSRLISDILVAMYRHKHFDAFRQSLTVGGVDGTIRNRFKDTPNRVFAKTGYISHVRSLSGYVRTDSGRWLVFSFIYNDIPQRGSAATKPYEELQDEAVRLLMRQ